MGIKMKRLFNKMLEGEITTLSEVCHFVHNAHNTKEKNSNSADSQIDILAKFIMAEVEGEPSQNESAVECAIRLIRESLPCGKTNKQSLQVSGCCQAAIKEFGDKLECSDCGLVLTWKKPLTNKHL